MAKAIQWIVVGFFLSTALVPAQPSRAATGPAQPITSDGWDWSFPYDVTPAPHTGFGTWGSTRYDEKITLMGLHVGWNKLNPSEGVYDWKPILEVMDKNRAAGLETALEIYGVERQYVPDWVVETYQPAVFEMTPLQDNQKWRVTNTAAWQPGVEKEYLKFMKAFAETGIPQREDLVAGLFSFISSARGEEMFMREIDAKLYAEKGGLTPDIFAQWYRRHTDATLDAYKDVEGKLAWQPPAILVPAYREGIAKYAESIPTRGTGLRGTVVDFQDPGLSTSPVWGTTMSPEGHFSVDDEHPTIVENRYRGDENEEYGKGWEWRFGPLSYHAYRHRVCSLRALQMRHNHVYVSSDTLKLNPQINQFVLQSLGRQRADSPDAWAYLCQWLPKDEKKVGLRNIERWLLQRDVEGSRSVAAEPTTRIMIKSNPQMYQEKVQDMDARRTDLKNGQNSLAFQLDPVFWSKPQNALVKVTFVDNAKGSWHLETTDENGQTVKSASVTNASEGGIKTTTFGPFMLSAKQGFPGKMDFHVVSEGPGDLTVHMVRVLKADWAGALAQALGAGGHGDQVDVIGIRHPAQMATPNQAQLWAVNSR